jgi:hypothetical protein
VGPITTRDQLVVALQKAANLEHQLMLQYLYTGFTLKRGHDATCTPAQYEVVRRWSSTLFMIARQEMEHLSLANGILTAIGAMPHFARQNIPPAGLLSEHYRGDTLAQGAHDNDPTPKSLRYAFTPFDLPTVERFVCGESPPYAKLPAKMKPMWCFQCHGGPPEAESAVKEEPVLPAGADPESVAAGTVEELYTEIKKAIAKLDGIFVDNPREVEVPVEYNVFVFPVTDRRTAIAAIDLILEQGEGLADPWNHDSHFRRFFEIHSEFVAMRARDTHFDPAYWMLPSPVLGKICNEVTKQVFNVANEAYVTLCLILASLYERAVPAHMEKGPYLSTALSQNAFAPAMTMILRALNEVLVLLPVEEKPEPDFQRTGSNFYIGTDDLKLLTNPRDADLGNITFLLERWKKLTTQIRDAATSAAGAAETKGTGVTKDIAVSLGYIRESACRTYANLNYTYHNGLYEKFAKVPPKVPSKIPPEPPTPARATSSGGA